jgi:NADH:ubiquinone oxidoreductase subunit 6 (subunit J)
MVLRLHKLTMPSLAAVAGLLLVAAPALALNAAGDAASPTDATKVAAPGGLFDAIMFYVVALVTVVSALGVCISRNVVRMAVWLFCTLGCVGLLYFLLAATFVGAIQFIVYVGGTLVLLIFGVMLTSKSPWARYETHPVELSAAVVVCVGLFSTLCLVFSSMRWPVVQWETEGTAVRDIGVALLTRYLVPFEAAAVLLFIVMVGAAHLARQEKK